MFTLFRNLDKIISFNHGKDIYLIYSENIYMLVDYVCEECEKKI